MTVWTFAMRELRHANAKAGVRAAIDRGVAVAEGGAAGDRTVHEASSPKALVSASRRAGRVYNIGRRVWRRPVLAPLPHVAVHIVEAPWVRLLLPDGLRLPPCIGVGPAVFHHRRFVLSKPPARLRP